MEREYCMSFLIALLGETTVLACGWWPSTDIPMCGARGLEKITWWRIWLPIAPALTVASALCGWAVVEPNPVPEGMPIALILMSMPFVLLLARADSGTGDVRLIPVDVTATCRRAYEEVRTLADSRNVALSMKLPKAPIYCNGDEQALERLWLILLDNAIKYTNADGRVTFSLTASSSQVEAEVEVC